MTAVIVEPTSQLSFPWMQPEANGNVTITRPNKRTPNVTPRQSSDAPNTISLREGRRVGQVRIGNVMLALLNKYGISDQEISDVLAMVAQEEEECQSQAQQLRLGAGSR